ncbi:MAG TPA: DUF1080 domain-containing protein [Tepidisphaeraceae bacterium]|nr:DUF1080 domain-containing protein [Tepidisphaeraceae bacterium]
MFNRILPVVLLSFVTGSALADDKALPPAPAGAVELFNGKDLTGWDGDPKLWSVKDGSLRGETTPENPAKGNTFIVLKDRKVGDFDLRFSFKMNAANNSGVQYRSKHITEGKTGNAWVVRGYQHELRNENKLPNVSGFIYDEGGKRGRICLVGEKAVWNAPTAEETAAATAAAKPADPKAKPAAGANGKKTVDPTPLITADEYAKLFKVDDWNEVAIIAKGNNVKHYMNGRLVLDFTDNHPGLALKEGVLALQLHAGKPMWVEYKNLRLAEVK